MAFCSMSYGHLTQAFEGEQMASAVCNEVADACNNESCATNSKCYLKNSTITRVSNSLECLLVVQDAQVDL